MHANNCNFLAGFTPAWQLNELDRLFTYDVINCDVHCIMFRYNPKANYQPNGVRYLQILCGKDLYKQMIVVSARTHDTFPARFPNIFVDYPLGQMHVRDKFWMNWNKAPLKLWETQLNFTVLCASSACGVSSAHLYYTQTSND